MKVVRARGAREALGTRLTTTSARQRPVCHSSAEEFFFVGLLATYSVVVVFCVVALLFASSALAFVFVCFFSSQNLLAECSNAYTADQQVYQCEDRCQVNKWCVIIIVVAFLKLFFDVIVKKNYTFSA